MFDLAKENWIPLIFAAVLGLTGGGASFYFSSNSKECDEMGDAVKLWTIEYISEHPPKEITTRLKEIDRALSKIEVSLKENSDKINQLYYDSKHRSQFD